MANAVSMLWRLEQEGIDVGDRWHRLHAIAHQRRADTTYVFASLHYLLALLGAGDTDAARDLLANLRQTAAASANDDPNQFDHKQPSDQAKVAADVGVAMAEAILSLHAGSPSPANLCELSQRLPQIGGSRAQRDVFLRTLLLMAADSGHADTFAAIGRIRAAMKTNDRFACLADSRFAGRVARPSTSSRSLLAGIV